MASKKQTLKPKKVDWKGYHKINLSPKDEVDFITWCETNEVQISDFDLLTNNGYKFSLNWDNYHEGVSASLTCQNSKLPFVGYTLSAWASTADMAIKLLFFKHYVMSSEEWDLVVERPDKNLSAFG
jgi:hypothetical protein